MYINKITFHSLSAILFILFTLVSANSSANETSVEAPNFTLKSNNTKNIKLSELRGQVVLINFWASWCGPCRQEMPELNKLYAKYKDLGFTIMGVNVEENPTEALKIIKDDKINFPILFDSENKVSQLYEVTAMPTSVLVSRSGHIRYIHRAYKPDDIEKYKKWVKELIRE
ncbi:MAG: TlpA family protein disulfide reductase [Gammaproteobacteria bacterium]|nr:TlpA family protein disulfide reductase [Gammaproteobacteria bacterium]